MKATISLFLAACAVSFSACAQEWPSKSVRVIVPYTAGSAPDVIARLIFERVQTNTGKSMVIENRGGASGMIGTAMVAHAQPDGYTLVVAPSGPLALNALLYKKVSYDPLKDLAPVSLVAETPTILVVNNKIAARDTRELLVEMVRPGARHAYASPGMGTLSHLDMAYLVALSGAADIPHIVYSGSPQAMTALMAGDVTLAVSSPLTAGPFVKAGRMKAVAAIGSRRSAMFPDLPTVKEQGVDFGPTSWFGVASTGGTPAPVLAQIHQQIVAALKDPEVLRSYQAQGLDVGELGPVAFAKYIKDDMDLWRPIIERHGITLD